MHRKVLICYFIYSLGIALLKSLFSSFSPAVSSIFGYFFFLAQIPALPVTYAISKYIVEGIFGVRLHYLYFSSPTFPSINGIVNFLNDLLIMIFTSITYILCYSLLRRVRNTHKA